MIELTFTSDPHASVVELFATSGFPAVLRIGKAMEVLFNVATVGLRPCLPNGKKRPFNRNVFCQI